VLDDRRVPLPQEGKGGCCLRPCRCQRPATYHARHSDRTMDRGGSHYRGCHDCSAWACFTAPQIWLDEGDRRCVQSPPAPGTGRDSHSVSRVTSCPDHCNLNPLIPDGILVTYPFSLGSFVDLPRRSRVSLGAGHICWDVRYRTRYAPHAGSSCFSPCPWIACVHNARCNDLIEGSGLGRPVRRIDCRLQLVSSSPYALPVS
jgi:hypothetical protein